ncbi:MAG: PP2C family protein-serine/threonine phosphatase [Bacteroidetes bacterium]|nr:PP2C family protein-serine/threonine phosphatase [Bacteroidota bacterium]
MSDNNSSKNNEPRIGKTLRDDIHQIKMKEDFGTEYRSLKEYYLTEERKKKLESMGKFKRFFIIPWWLLKALFFKLTPFRRILLLIAIVLIMMAGDNKISSDNVSINLVGTAMIGGLILLFILALELKDKLLARTELAEGRAVQKALMPEANPEVAGWDIWLYTKPANDVGGDLLDFLKLSEDKVCISVGDVAGKGLSAALLMAKLQSTIRAIVPDYNSLMALGEKINRIFCRDSLPKLFASLVYIELDVTSGKIKILNAGHLPPLIIRNDIIEKLKITSPALGLIPDTLFNEQTAELHTGEYLIIYSDGLTEALNEEGNFFGENKLVEILTENSNQSSESLGGKILAEISTFIGKTKIHDDLTIAIIKRTAV